MDTLTVQDIEAMRALLNEAALGNWQVGDIILASGLREFEVYEGDDDDANSMALCYEERVAEFIAAAPDFCRKALAALAELPHLEECTDALVQVREHVLAPQDDVTAQWLGEAVAFPSGIVGAVKARMEQLASLRTVPSDEALAGLRERYSEAWECGDSKHIQNDGHDLITALESETAALRAKLAAYEEPM